jgi:hypothetical protein
MGIVPEAALPASERVKVHPKRVTWPDLANLRLIALVLLTPAVALAPDAWLRALAFLCAGVFLVGVGYWEGRRDLALGLLRNSGEARRAARDRTQSEGG